LANTVFAIFRVDVFGGGLEANIVLPMGSKSDENVDVIWD
jgi:hypothetical protein